MMLGLLADFVTGGALSGIFGSITGLIGDFAQKKHDEKMARIHADERARERQYELEVLRREGENAIAVANIRRQEADDVASAGALAASYQMEPKRYSEGVELPKTFLGNVAAVLIGLLMYLLDFVRGIIRPGMTLYLLVVVTLIYLHTLDLQASLGLTPSPDEVWDLIRFLTNSFIYLLTACVMWWFGGRHRGKPPAAPGRAT